MVNSLKIKGKIVEQDTTISKLAAEMGLSAYSLGQKIGGKSIMTLDEADKLQNLLNIPDCEFKSYFFAS